jgi:hypothetical protein
LEIVVVESTREMMMAQTSFAAMELEGSFIEATVKCGLVSVKCIKGRSR